jgi:deoxyribodipyrimidine photolyase
MDTAIVVFTRDLRLHDNPALHQAYVRPRPGLDPHAVAAAPAQRVRLGYPGPLGELA